LLTAFVGANLMEASITGICPAMMLFKALVATGRKRHTAELMTRIVTTHYSYKRPPGKKKPVAIGVPEILSIPDRKRRRALPDEAKVTGADKQSAPPPADDRKPAIVTIKRSGKRFADAFRLQSLTFREP
jgi:hypothetical protein